MTLNDYIAVLSTIAKAEDGHRGELEVVQRDPYAPPGALRRAVRLPEICMIKAPTKREQYRKVAGPTEETTGQKVVLL